MNQSIKSTEAGSPLTSDNAESGEAAAPELRTLSTELYYDTTCYYPALSSAKTNTVDLEGRIVQSETRYYRGPLQAGDETRIEHFEYTNDGREVRSYTVDRPYYGFDKITGVCTTTGDSCRHVLTMFSSNRPEFGSHRAVIKILLGGNSPHSNMVRFFKVFIDDKEEETQECTHTFYSSKFEGHNGRDGEIAANVLRKLRELCSASVPELSGESRMTESKQQSHPLHY